MPTRGSSPTPSRPICRSGDTSTIRPPVALTEPIDCRHFIKGMPGGNHRGKLIVPEFITLDGVIDSPGERGWACKFSRGEDGDKFKEEDVATEVTSLNERTDGDDLVAGSANLVRTLAEHDLVDQYRLMVFPTLVGAGKRLFGEGGPQT